ncbi:MAG: hypothetical protein AAFP03_15010 [Cyanobacteria bacterium J06598_3]
MKMIRLMCLSLLLLLTSCSTLNRVFTQTPPDQAVELAIANQLSHTQQSLAQNLGLLDNNTLPSSLKPNFKIEKVNIQKREKLTEPDRLNYPQVDEIYRVSGTFEASLNAPDYEATKSLFEVYLGSEETDPAVERDVDTWFLLQR